MFTDWSNTDPHYFFIRGAIYGFVAATIIWKVAIPAIIKRFD